MLHQVTVILLPPRSPQLQQAGYDLIFTGKETIDYNSSSIGGMVAELLDLPYVSLATKLDVAGSTATLNREIEGGEESIELALPASSELSERYG